MSSYWVVVGSEDNFLIAKSRGFDMFGFKSRRRREASEMRSGDKLIFYLTKIMKFGGIAAITSEYYEDHDRIFLVEPKKKAEEDYPWRVATKPEIILEPTQYLDVQAIAPRMEHTKKWPPEHWRLAFQGNLRQVPESDYQLILDEAQMAIAPQG